MRYNQDDINIHVTHLPTFSGGTFIFPSCWCCPDLCMLCTFLYRSLYNKSKWNLDLLSLWINFTEGLLDHVIRVSLKVILQCDKYFSTHHITLYPINSVNVSGTLHHSKCLLRSVFVAVALLVSTQWYLTITLNCMGRATSYSFLFQASPVKGENRLKAWC